MLLTLWKVEHPPADACELGRVVRDPNDGRATGLERTLNPAGSRAQGKEGQGQISWLTFIAQCNLFMPS
jgi:hypothetical protein